MTTQPDFATRPRPPQATGWLRSLVVVGALVLCGASAHAWRARIQSSDARARLGEARREIEQQAARLRALAPIETPTPATSSPARIVAALAGVLPADVRLSRLTIDYRQGTMLELAIEARNAQGWDELLERLERSAQFADVVPGPESRDGEVRTVIHARWAGATR